MKILESPKKLKNSPNLLLLFLKITKFLEFSKKKNYKNHSFFTTLIQSPRNYEFMKSKNLTFAGNTYWQVTNRVAKHKDWIEKKLFSKKGLFSIKNPKKGCFKLGV